MKHILFKISLNLFCLVVFLSRGDAECKDTKGRESNCKAWAKNGFCKSSTSYHFMRNNCQKSCRFCTGDVGSAHGSKNGPDLKCQDAKGQKSNCKAWVNNGFCKTTSRYYQYMKKQCQKSCKFCTGDTAPTRGPKRGPDHKCKDENQQNCKDWVNFGFCSTRSEYYDHVSKNCKKSCNLCTEQTTSKPRPTIPSVVRPSSLLNSEFCGMTSVDSVVGGKETKPGEWPWMVGLERKSKSGSIICGASLLTDEWVLSATHCFLGKGKQDPSKYMVRIGEHHLKQTGGELIVNLDRIITHEHFDDVTYDNDIALLHLAKRVQFTPAIRPACIPDRGDDFAVGTKCIVTGWGYLGEGKGGPDVLHAAKVPIVNRKLCVNNFKKVGETVTEQMLCAGHVKGGIDSCEGDSGGPLVCRSANGGKYKQAGVVSWGYGCARPNMFGVYTKLSTMRNWIESKVNPKREP